MLSKVPLLLFIWDKHALRMSEMTSSVDKVITAYFPSVLMFSLDTFCLVFTGNFNINIMAKVSFASVYLTYFNL